MQFINLFYNLSFMKLVYIYLVYITWYPDVMVQRQAPYPISQSTAAQPKLLRLSLQDQTKTNVVKLRDNTSPVKQI